MLLWAADMTKEQLAACKLSARALAGETGRTLRMYDMHDIVWDGNCTPEHSFSRVTFSIGLDRFQAVHVLDNGIYRAEFVAGRSLLPQLEVLSRVL